MAFSGPITVYGAPGDIGGAATELWHTLKLWRSLGISIAVRQTSRLSDVWLEKLIGIGCAISTGWKADSIVVGFCSSAMRKDADTLRANGCRTIYAPCMNWLWPQEAHSLLFDRYVFQSEYQRRTLMMRYGVLGLGEENTRLIRGAFDRSEFPFIPRPHTPGDPFVIGRLSRDTCPTSGMPALDKYPRDLWEQYAAIPYRPLKARVMGWNAAIERHCGRPPEWAEVLPQGAETSQEFLSSLHCLVPGNGCCAENWPRVGLEAMAAGVPVLAENKGGWPEMLPAARFIAPYGVRQLAENESVRMNIAKRQSEHLQHIADPGTIGAQWLELFEEVASCKR